MTEEFIVLLILLVVNLIFCLRPTPIPAFMVTFFTIVLGVTLVSDTSIPLNPTFTVAIMVLSGVSLYINAQAFRESG